MRPRRGPLHQTLALHRLDARLHKRSGQLHRTCHAHRQQTRQKALNPSQEGALDALVAQLVAQPALLRQLLARLLLSPRRLRAAWPSGARA